MKQFDENKRFNFGMLIGATMICYNISETAIFFPCLSSCNKISSLQLISANSRNFDWKVESLAEFAFEYCCQVFRLTQRYSDFRKIFRFSVAPRPAANIFKSGTCIPRWSSSSCSEISRVWFNTCCYQQQEPFIQLNTLCK